MSKIGGGSSPLCRTNADYQRFTLDLLKISRQQRAKNF